MQYLTAGCKGKCSLVFWIFGLICITLVQEMFITVYGVSIAFGEKWLTETHTQSHVLLKLSKIWCSLESLYIIVLIDATFLKV